jgi:hypothetical protein
MKPTKMIVDLNSNNSLLDFKWKLVEEVPLLTPLEAMIAAQMSITILIIGSLVQVIIKFLNTVALFTSVTYNVISQIM